MWRSRNAAAVLALLLALAIVLVDASSSGAATTKIGLAQQPSITVQTGQTFYLTVAVNDVTDLYGWQFDVEYNSTYLEFVKVVEGPMLRSDGAMTFFVPPTTEPGKVLHPAATRLAPADTGVDGSGDIAYVFFRALKDTNGTTVTVKNAMLVDRNALEISKDYINGGRCTVIISSAAPVYVQPPIEGEGEEFTYLPLVLRPAG